MNILVTGATGYIGQALISHLLEGGHHVIALSRTSKHSKKFPKVKWLEGDLMMADTLPKLPPIDRAYYLVHGLKGQSQDFEFQEAMAAVNFVNWVRPENPGIIYLGAIVPKEELSPHLRSRMLTGAILGSSGMNVAEFRASIVLGSGSLSFEMIKAITERFPFIPEMKILNQPCQPIGESDVMKYLMAILEYQQKGHEIFEIAGPDVATYGELLELYAELKGLNRKKIKFPDVDAKVLIKALDYSIPEHAQIGKKLTESLEHATVRTSDKALKIFPDILPMDLRTAMDLAQASSRTTYAPLWEKDFIKLLLNDKILTQSGLLSPELLRNLEKVGKIRNLFSRK
jgi:uncharacterized protein YbjT (DUF2867 family)